MSHRATAIFVFAAVLNIACAAIPDSMGDLLSYRLWTRALARGGLVEAYWPPPPPADASEIQPAVDYPPLFPYLLWGLGHSLAALSSGALQNDRLLDVLIRLLLSAASLVMAFLVYSEARRVSSGVADLTLGLVALNPAIILDTAYWGQADALWAVLLVAALLALVRGQPAWSWVAVTAALMTKPLASPFAPLIALETLKRFGPRRTLQCALAAAGTAALGLLPFAWDGRLSDVLYGLVGQIDAMPFVSVNAHNLWWLIGRGAPWTEAAVRPLGLVSYESWSFLFFGTFYVVTLVHLWRSRGDHAVYVAAAGIAIGFFVLSTHMHENHLFGALPLLALAGLRARRARLFLLVATATSLANMSLHDPLLTTLLRPLTPGPHLRLPQQFVTDPHLGDYLVSHGYPQAAEQLVGKTSLLGALATLVNAQANVLLFAAFLLAAYRRSVFDDALQGSRVLPARRIWIPAVVALVVASGVPFVRRALHYSEQHFVLVYFSDATVRSGVASGVRIDSFDIGGERRAVLYVHPPSEVSYHLTPPPGTFLNFGIALRPEVWSPEKGDGVTFEVRAEFDGQSTTLLSRYIDPKHDPMDRRWHDVRVDLSSYAGRPITLVFATTGGPAGNVDFDWAGFSDPTLEGR